MTAMFHLSSRATDDEAEYGPGAEIADYLDKPPRFYSEIPPRNSDMYIGERKFKYKPFNHRPTKWGDASDDGARSGYDTTGTGGVKGGTKPKRSELQDEIFHLRHHMNFLDRKVLELSRDGAQSRYGTIGTHGVKRHPDISKKVAESEDGWRSDYDSNSIRGDEDGPKTRTAQKFNYLPLSTKKFQIPSLGPPLTSPPPVRKGRLQHEPWEKDAINRHERIITPRGVFDLKYGLIAVLTLVSFLRSLQRGQWRN
jgi:hypothetical protein